MHSLFRLATELRLPGRLKVKFGSNEISFSLKNFEISRDNASEPQDRVTHHSGCKNIKLEFGWIRKCRRKRAVAKRCALLPAAPCHHQTRCKMIFDVST